MSLRWIDGSMIRCFDGSRAYKSNMPAAEWQRACVLCFRIGLLRLFADVSKDTTVHVKDVTVDSVGSL